jgi:hypothetical protein
MEQKRFVIVLPPDELEPPEVGFNDEVTIQIVEDSVEESPLTELYIIRYQPPLRFLFDLGGLPALVSISCAMFKYDDYTVLPVDLFNFITFMVCSYNIRQKHTISERPREVYNTASGILVSTGYIQLLVSGVCLTQSKFITMSISFYQYVLIQMLLLSRLVEEINIQV